MCSRERERKSRRWNGCKKELVCNRLAKRANDPSFKKSYFLPWWKKTEKSLNVFFPCLHFQNQFHPYGGSDEAWVNNSGQPPPPPQGTYAQQQPTNSAYGQQNPYFLPVGLVYSKYMFLYIRLNTDSFVLYNTAKKNVLNWATLCQLSVHDLCSATAFPPCKFSTLSFRAEKSA